LEGTTPSEDPQRAGRRLVLAVRPTRQLLPERDQRLELVGLEHGLDALQDRRHAVEPHARVDALRRQRCERAGTAGGAGGRVLVVLHEHEVPELEEALGVVAGPVVGSAELGPAIEVQLAAGPARSDGSRLPEVVLAAEQHDALGRDADLHPLLDCLVVRPEAEVLVASMHRDPDVLGLETEALSGQLPRERDSALLEVVADREVAEHLEEREVSQRVADVVDVSAAEALLARGEALGRGLLETLEIRLQRVHPGRGEQHGRVERRGHKRAAGEVLVTALHKEVGEGGTDLVGRHAHVGAV